MSRQPSGVTAILGYLIALRPRLFCQEFKINGTPESVRLETRHENGRSDILIETSQGYAIVEAKVGTLNPLLQSQKYPARWRILISEHLPSPQERQLRNVCFRRWQDIADFVVKNQAEFRTPYQRVVSNDLISHLKEHAMIKTEPIPEIYARDINSSDDMADLFLKGQLYGCPYKRDSNLPKCRYFAPYFGQVVSCTHPGLQEGISYIAEIETVQVAHNFAELIEISNKQKTAAWTRKQDKYFQFVRREFFSRSNTAFSFVFLGSPRLVFNPPIKKQFLVRGKKAFLNRHFFTFTEFFKAWQGQEAWK